MDFLDPSQYATLNYVDGQDALKVTKIGDTLTGPLTFKVAGTTTSAIVLENKNSTQQTLQIKSTGGAGSANIFEGRNGTAIWVHNYNSGHTGNQTTAKFAYQYYSFYARDNVSYEAIDEHTFKGPINLNGTTTVNATIAVKTPGSSPKSIFQVVPSSTVEASKAEYFGSVSTDKSIATKESVLGLINEHQGPSATATTEGITRLGQCAVGVNNPPNLLPGQLYFNLDSKVLLIQDQ